MTKDERKLKKSIKNPFGDKVCYIACFFISLFIICCIYILKKVVPFGTNTLLDTDFYYQYSVMIAEMRDRILSNASKIYSFHSGLGLPIYRNFLNYVSSPMNIITLFFPRHRFMMSFSFVIGLRAVLTSCFMLFFLNRKKGKNSFSNIPFAVVYAFSGYFSSYYINVMWMDSMMLIPLVAVGIDSIVKEKKWILYCTSLAIAIFSNYYTGFMICIFACLYFLYSFILNTTFGKLSKKMLREIAIRFIKTGILFALVSILAASLCVTSLFLIKSSLDTFDATNDLELFPSDFYFDINVRDVLFSHFNGAYRTWFYSDSIIVPGIAVGVLPLFLVFAFIFNKEIPLKEKVLNIILMSFFLAALFVPQIDSLLHAFHVPNDFPYRYAFMYSFILLMISAESFDRLKGVSYIKILTIFIVLIGALIWYGLQTAMDEESVLSSDILVYNTIFLTLYTIIILINKNYSITKVITSVLLICTSVELILVYNNLWNLDQDEALFINDYNDFKPVLKWIEDNDKEKFYRMEKTDYLSLNDGSWNNYNGVTIFSSMAYSGMSKLQQSMGIPGNGSYSYIYTDTSPLYNLLFDVKYVLDGFKVKSKEQDFYYDEININSKSINKFKYTSGIGFAVNNELCNLKINTTDPFAVQNEFVKKSSNVENDIFIPAKVTSEEIYKDDDRSIFEFINRFRID
ncbi:MAG: YfhO family protein, partial [Clostridia bacterium]|nr:YfhO family protein [Clostridia bacterium]